jgi:radical SAM superfamily enzyme YgiQ (UPF0313 family)
MAKVLFALKELEVYDPIGILTLAAVLRQAGHLIRIVACSEADISAVAADFAPHIIAFSATTGAHSFYYSLNRTLAARFRFVSIMGGPHATFFPEDQQASGINLFCRGEGEGALLDLASCVESGASYEGVSNLVLHARPNPLRPLIGDLDSLPFCERESYYRGTWLERHPTRSFMVSRGCPHDCPYCFNSQWKRMYRGLGECLRKHSVDRVVDEVEFVRRRFMTQFVRFNDDIFAHGLTRWLEEFAEKYRRRVGLPFECYMRPELIDEEMARVLKDAGCRSVRMGIECGDEKVRKDLLGRPASNDRIVDAFHLLRRRGITTMASTMLALPGTDAATDEKSVRLTARARPDFAYFSVFQPYPGTSLARMCVVKEDFDEKYSDFSPYFGSSYSPLRSFSSRAKTRHVLLSSWGTVAAFLPNLSEFVILLFSRIPSFFLAFLTYFLVKVFVNKSRISPVRLSVCEAFRQLGKVYKLEKERRVPGVSTSVSAILIQKRTRQGADARRAGNVTESPKLI